MNDPQEKSPEKTAAPQEDADGQSTVPPNWPGIPGRSQEQEHNPNRERQAPSVTEQQRELERAVPTPKP